MLKQTERAYLAGFFDAEGSVYQSTRQVVIKLGNTDETSVRNFQELFGGSIYTSTLPSGKLYYMWRCPSDKYIEVAEMFRPHGHVKRNLLYLAAAYQTLVRRKSSRTTSIQDKVRKARHDCALGPFPPRNRNSRTLLAYLAGLFDGDGFVQGKPGRTASLTSTEPYFLDWLVSLYGGNRRVLTRTKNTVKQPYS